MYHVVLARTTLIILTIFGLVLSGFIIYLFGVIGLLISCRFKIKEICDKF